MTRRSTRLARLENSLYTYNSKKEVWDVLEANLIKSGNESKDLFDLGSYFTCKHMSQKVNPISFRMDVNRTWDSSWYSNYKNVGLNVSKLHKDLIIRNYLSSIFSSFYILISKIQIKERDNVFFVRLHLHDSGVSSKKSTLIDQKRKKRFKSHLSEKVDRETINPFFKSKEDSSRKAFVNMPKLLSHLETSLHSFIGQPIYLSVVYVKDIGDSASLLCNHLVTELEKPNMNFKRALKDTLLKILKKDNIRGLRVNCSGRLGRAPMAKMEWFKYGSIPLTKLSANIDYKYMAGKTKYGSFGIKVWLYKY